MSNFKGKKILVLGMGETGLSMTKWLARQGAMVSVADSRDMPPNLSAVSKYVKSPNIYTGRFRAEAFKGIELIAISPGVPLTEPLVQRAMKNKITVVGDIELFAQALSTQHSKLRTRILGITGSNGKTTVTSMVGAMCANAGLRTQVAGNISPAVLDVLSDSEDSGVFPEAWVLELSSYQLETTYSLRTQVATVLNISEDHLDRYLSMEDYARAKARIFEGAQLQVVNRDDDHTMKMAKRNKPIVSFGLGVPQLQTEWGLVESQGERWLARGNKPLMKSSELQVTGLHNVANALASLALCHAIDLPDEPLLNALHQFKGLPHRVERVAEIKGVTFYDDSKGTNVGATVAALNGMPGKVVLIAGGEGKNQDFSPLKSAVANHARAVVLIGRDAPLIRQAIASSNVPLVDAATMDSAVDVAFSQAKSGDAVLLSPACASFDMFRNYEHRAEVFVAAVKKLGDRE